MAKKFGDAYIEVHARTKGFYKDIAEVEATLAAMDDDKTIHVKVKKDRDFDNLSATMARLGKLADTTGTRISRAAKKSRKSWNPFHILQQKMAKSWARMDSTVRLVLGLIATAGGPASSAMSGLSAAIAAVASSAALAVSALAPLIGVLPGFAYGIGLAVKGLQDLEAYSPGAYGALQDLKSAFTDVDVPAFMAQWTPALEGFFSTLADSLAGDQLATGLGQAFASITEALTALIESPGFTAFVGAFEPGGPLQSALANLGSALAPLLEGLLTFFAAAAPYAAELAEDFLEWATAWNEGIGQAVQDPAFQSFFEQALASLDSVLALTGAVGDLLGTIFVAGAESGNTMLDSLTGVITQFNEFLNTVQGQQVLEDFFSRGEAIMGALGDVLIGLAGAFDAMITPETTALFIDFAEVIGQFLPILGEMLEVISHLGILNLVADLFLVIGQALDPILPVLKELANTIFVALGDAIQALAPILSIVGGLIGVLAEALGPIVGFLGEALVSIFETLAPIFQDVATALAPVIQILAEALMSALQAVLPFIVELINKLGPVLTAVIQALLPILGALMPIFDALLPVFVALIPALFPVINLIAELAPIITPLIDLVAQLVTWLLELITPLIQLIAPILELVAHFLVAKLGIKGFGDEVAKVFNRVIKWFDDIAKAVVTWVNKVMGFFRGFGTSVSNFFTQFFSRFVSTWKNNFTAIYNFVANIINNIVTFFIDFGAKFISLGRGIVQTILKTIKTFATNAFLPIATLGDNILGIWDRIKDGAKAALDSIVGFFTSIPDKISGALGSIGDLAGGLLDFIPGFAAGGIVTGPTTALVGEAGPEAIIPLNRPLNLVDPSVRAVSAMLQGGQTQGFASGGIVGGGVTVAEGAIVVHAPESNPALVAESVIDRLAAYSR